MFLFYNHLPHNAYPGGMHREHMVWHSVCLSFHPSTCPSYWWGLWKLSS